MHNWPLEDDLPPQKRQILLSMWKAGAIGKREITLRDLKARLTGEVKQNYMSYVKNLESRLFIKVSHEGKENTASITPLGLAYVRQIQDDDLKLITGDR